MHLFRGSIRKKLILLVLFALSSVFVLLLLVELDERRRILSQSEDNAIVYLNTFTQIQKNITHSAKSTLHMLANHPYIQQGITTDANATLRTVLDENLIYNNILQVDLSGNVIAAGRNYKFRQKNNYSGEKHFQDAVSKQHFSTGEFTVAKSTDALTFNFALPVLNPQKQLTSVLLLSIDLNNYDQLLTASYFPDEISVGLFDHKGVRLFRYPALKTPYIGEQVVDKVWKGAKGTSQISTITIVTPDGQKRVVWTKPLRTSQDSSPYMYACVGFDYVALHEKANRSLYRLLTIDFIILVLVLLAAWFLGGNVIARDIERLARMMEEFGHGNSDVYSDLDYKDGELGILAESCDTMVRKFKNNEMERNKTLKQLRISEMKFRAIIEDVSSIAIHGYDEERRVIFWNPTCEKLYGFSKEDALGQKIEDLIIPHALKDNAIKFHNNLLENPRSVALSEVAMIDKYGKDVHVFSSIVLHESIDGKEMFSLDVDMSPLLDSEADKEALLAKLRQAQKMEAIGTLAGGIAHDFNNILVPIIGYTEMLIDDLSHADEGVKDHLKQIHTSSLRARELVKQILTFSRQGGTNYEALEIQHILREVINLSQATIPDNVKVFTQIDSNCYPVQANGTEVHQVIMNLVTNAIHAMAKNGGELRVELIQVDLSSNEAQFCGLKEAGSFAQMIIADTGEGMAFEVMEKIFDPFFTTKGVGKGTGMGLSVAHGIIQNMGGAITVDSKVGAGTQFKVYYPSDKLSSVKEVNVLTDSIILDAGHERIMLVDDEIIILQVLKKNLTKLGYKVDTYYDPLEALEDFATSSHLYDLLITDLSMPELPGQELVEKVLSIRDDIKVIVCSGYNESITADDIKLLGVHDVLSKPIRMVEMGERIRAVLDCDN